MFVANDIQIRIANDRLDELRMQADRRRLVQLARRAARTTPSPRPEPPATVHTIAVASDPCPSTEDRAA